MVVNTTLKVILEILFLILSNGNVQFLKKKLIWRSYIITKALPTIKQVEFINKKKFAKVALDENFKTFIIYMASFNLTLASRTHSDKTAWIPSLFTKKVKILEKYLDFANVFLEEKNLVLPKRIKFNEHVIYLEDGKHPLYRPIYSLGLVKLEILKTYIKTHLKIGFI